MAVHSEKGTDTDKKLLGCIPEKNKTIQKFPRLYLIKLSVTHTQKKC